VDREVSQERRVTGNLLQNIQKMRIGGCFEIFLK
jgi:hypothetical protein